MSFAAAEVLVCSKSALARGITALEKWNNSDAKGLGKSVLRTSKSFNASGLLPVKQTRNRSFAKERYHLTAPRQLSRLIKDGGPPLMMGNFLPHETADSSAR